jgi:SAM-dependent methyltransferase
MPGNIRAETQDSDKAGQVGPDSYALWRASKLGAITESLEKDLVRNLAGSLSGKSVLDVGCGDGTLAAEFARMQAALVVGCDPDPRMIAKAITQKTAAGSRASYLRGRIEHLPFRDQSFDVVTAVTVLCFVEDQSHAVKEMARVLRLGGRLVVAGLGRWSTWAGSRRIRGWLGDEFWARARFTTAQDLRILAELAALHVDQVRGGIYYPRSAIAARAMKSLDPLLGRITTFGAAFVAIEATKPA